MGASEIIIERFLVHLIPYNKFVSFFNSQRTHDSTLAQHSLITPTTIIVPTKFCSFTLPTQEDLTGLTPN